MEKRETNMPEELETLVAFLFVFLLVLGAVAIIVPWFIGIVFIAERLLQG